MNESGVDIPSTIAVVSALVVCLVASWYAMRFARTVGGDLGGAFRWVNGGVLVFAVTRADDVLKMSGVFVRMGVNYQKVVWLPHSIAVAAAWMLIAYGFYRMARAFSA